MKALTFFKGDDLDDVALEVRKDLIRAAARVGDLPPVPAVQVSLGGSLK